MPDRGAFSDVDSSQEDLADEIVADYLEAIERGEKPVPQQILADHPELKSELSEFFAGYQRLHRYSPSDSMETSRFRATSDTDRFERSAGGPADQPRLRRFGDFELLEEIARGGMGVVYRARQVSLNRIVAIKMILAGSFASEEEVKRFLYEAEAAAQLNHPGIVPIYEIGQQDGQHYFSMGYVEGTSLAKRLLDGPVAPVEAAALVRQVALAVEYAHSKQVIHRDLKPANILIDQRDVPWVSDFGLAKRLEADSALTGTGQILGTPSYMPPEQAAAKLDQIGAWSDVYSLGAVLFAALTGRPPFQAATPLDTLLQVQQQEPVSLRSLNEKIPVDLETIALKCLDKSPGRRYGSAQQLADELQRFLEGHPILASPISRIERSWRLCRRNPVVAGLSAAVFLTLIASTLIASRFAYGERQQAIAANQAKNDESVQRKIADQQTQTALAATARANREAEAALHDRTHALELAKANSALADQERRSREKAELNANQLLKQTNLAKRHVYNAQMILAQSSWENSRVRQTLQFLDFYRPSAMHPIKDDLRGFEWYYWDKWCHSELATLNGHTAEVEDVAISPDGKLIASASSDETIRLWDANNGQLWKTLEGHDGQVQCVVFNHDGTRLASSGDDGVRLWDVASGELLQTLDGHSDRVTCVAFSPNGRQLASGSWDDTIKIWSLDTGICLHTLRGHEGEVWSIAYHPDGDHLASASTDYSIRIWNPVTGRLQKTLLGHTDRVMCVSYNVNGTKLASGGRDHTVIIWDTKSNTERLRLNGHTDRITNVTFSPDSERVASASRDQTVRVWKLEQGAQPQTIRGHANRVTGVAFSPDGDRLITSSWDQTIKLWDSHLEQRARVCRGHRDEVYSVAISSDGRLVASGGRDDTARLWSTQTGKLLQTFRGHSDSVKSVNFTEDGSKLFTAGRDNSVRCWDVSNGQQLAVFPHPVSVYSVACHQDCQRFATSDSDGTVRIWKTASDQPLFTIPAHADVAWCVAFNRQGSELASAGGDGSIQIWDVETGVLRKKLMGHTADVTSVDFSPDGTQLASSSWDKTVRIWDLAAGSESVVMNGHTDLVWSVAYSPDGRRVASASDDRTVKVWDTVTGQETLTLNGHTDEVYSVAFGRNGKLLVSGGWDRTVRIWDADSHQPAESLQARRSNRN